MQNLPGNVHARLDFDDHRLPVIQVLAAQGFMTCSPAVSGFAVQIALLGMRSLQVTEPVTASTLLCEVRLDVQPSHLHSYEFMLILHDAGWEWRPLPSRPTARNALPHHMVGRPKICCLRVCLQLQSSHRKILKGSHRSPPKVDKACLVADTQKVLKREGVVSVSPLEGTRH